MRYRIVELNSIYPNGQAYVGNELTNYFVAIVLAIFHEKQTGNKTYVDCINLNII